MIIQCILTQLVFFVHFLPRDFPYIFVFFTIQSLTDPAFYEAPPCAAAGLLPCALYVKMVY